MLRLKNPATDELIATLPEFTEDEVSEAFYQAKSKQQEWASTPYEKRANVLKKFKNLLNKNKLEAATELSLQMGKPLRQAISEIEVTCKRIEWFINETQKQLATESVHSQKNLEEKISYQPLGVVANISAWNYPFFVGTNVFVPALLTGCTVLYKPSELCALSGKRIGELLATAGCPEGVFTVIQGGAQVGSYLSQLSLDGLFFTGSYKTGRKILSNCAEKLMTRVFELGGKDPAYVCDDAKLEETVATLVSGVFYNTGQSCCSVERIYVHEKIYDLFCREFAKKTEDLILEDPCHDSCDLGPLARKEQVSYLSDQVEDALQKGASYLISPRQIPEKGNYFSPIILIGVDHSMKIMREESFGPVIGIQKVSSDGEALKLMDDTPYGLTASVHSSDKKRAVDLLSQLKVGTAYWNTCDRISSRLPWSGQKSSGMGATLSHLGIKTFLHPKAWHLIS